MPREQIPHTPGPAASWIRKEGRPGVTDPEPFPWFPIVTETLIMSAIADVDMTRKNRGTPREMTMTITEPAGSGRVISEQMVAPNRQRNPQLRGANPACGRSQIAGEPGVNREFDVERAHPAGEDQRNARMIAPESARDHLRGSVSI